MVDTVRDIRSRIVHVDPDLVKHTLGAELATIWRGRLCDPVGEEDCDLSRMEANCLRQRKLAVGKQAESGGPVLSSVHLTSPESSNMKLGMWPALAYDSVR
jgi:hypothetical protein